MPITGRHSAAKNAGHLPADEVRKALELMERALNLLDDHAGPNDAGAHLDLAVHRLRDWLDSERG